MNNGTHAQRGGGGPWIKPPGYYKRITRLFVWMINPAILPFVVKGERHR